MSFGGNPRPSLSSLQKPSFGQRHRRMSSSPGIMHLKATVGADKFPALSEAHRQPAASRVRTMSRPAW